MLSAPVGGHAMNLAALSAAPAAGQRPLPPGLLEAAAGLALIGTLAASVSSALAVDSQGPRNA